MRIRAKEKDGWWYAGDEFDVIVETESFYKIRHPRQFDLIGGWYKKHFDIIEEHNPIQEAVQLLIDQGYTITPPKPKRKGQMYLYEIGGRVYGYDAQSGDRPPLAILNWTEGDGI